MALPEFLLNISVYGGSTLCVVLIFLLSKDWEKIHSKRVMIGMLVTFILLLVAYGRISLLGKSDAIVLILIVSSILCLGPLLYSYIETVFTINYVFGWKFWRRFIIPLIITWLFIMTFYYQIDGIAGIYTILLVMIYLNIYIYQSYRLIHNYRKRLKDTHSHLDQKDLKWLTTWIKGIVIIMFVDAIIGGIIATNPAMYHFGMWSVVGCASFILYMGYHGLRQDSVFLPSYTAKDYTPDRTIDPSELGKFENLASRLVNLFENDEIYRDEQLNLRQLANQMQISDKRLSELLNVHLESNFYDFVNGYRVREFKNRLKKNDYEGYTLLGVALECGFSSKASFYRIFKQFTGLTPNTFKRQLDKK